jgi:hypothetical protein
MEILEPRLAPSVTQVYPGPSAIQIAVDLPHQGGDLIELHAGHYAGFCADQSGTLNNHITIEAAGDGPVLIDLGGPAMFAGSHWYLKGVTISNPTGDGVDIVKGADFIYMLQDDISNNQGWGVYDAALTSKLSFQVTPGTAGDVIDNNLLGGIYAEGVKNLIVRGAVIDGNHGPGVEAIVSTGQIQNNAIDGDAVALAILNSPGLYIGNNQ